MGSQACSSLDASTRTRILTPSSDGAPVSNDAPSGERKKRKWDGDAMEDLLDDVLVLKPHPSTVFSKPHTLWPIALLPRLNLPLSCLDTASSGGPLPVSRLFETHVKVLELEYRLGSAPMVLIAHSEDGKSHFAIERESRDLYAVCKLGSWVRINHLCLAAVVLRSYLQRGTTNDVGRPPSTKGSIENSVITAEASKYNKKKRLAIEAIQSMVKRPSRDISAVPQNTAVGQPHSKTDMEPHLREPDDVAGSQGEVLAQPAATDILENIRSQYFEALYISKASLAYFAKGPLSRARAAFHLDYDSTLDMNDLIAFLESLVLPTSVVDKKYKDTLPNLVSALIIGSGSADEAQKTASKSKKAKIKKMKLGKDGMYPTEDIYITRWWNSHDASVDPALPGETKEDVLRKRVAQLRIRETQLQMIVILETLALQPLATPQADRDENLPATKVESGTLDGKLARAGKPKKPLDLAVLIEVLVDRLCIWQSVAAEAGISVSKVEGGSNIGGKSAGTEKHNDAADMLREFCVEVIVPFFSARLPEQCGAISRKLGGPVVVSPVRPKQYKSSSSSTAIPRPGAVTKRLVPSRTRESLQRVLTDERHQRSASRGPSGAISLMRSATAPVVPGLKRESSESPLLESIPNFELQSLAVSRGGVLKTKKFSQREVDLSSLAPGNDAKSKKPNIEAELKEAILALKRPNRQLAGQLTVETAERRTASAPTNCRKSKKPVRNPSFQSVQIVSTPKGNRCKDVSLSTPPIISLSVGSHDEMEAIPPSSLPRIPLSVNRSTNIGSQEATPQCQATPARITHETKPGTTIQVTPCRRGTGLASRLSSGFTAQSSRNHDSIDLGSPQQVRQSNKTQSYDLLTPSIQAIDCTPMKGFTVQATPMKAAKLQLLDEGSSSKLAIHSCQEIETEGGERENNDGSRGSRGGGSIYETLGWDDFDDLA